MALSGEVGELTALFQWLAPDEVEDWLRDEANDQAVREELVDVFAYLVRFAAAVDVDILVALEESSASTRTSTRSSTLRATH
jgi:NTP pyrophosphatase (non-canonical NTP hydrolase)